MFVKTATLLASQNVIDKDPIHDLDVWYDKEEQEKNKILAEN